MCSFVLIGLSKWRKQLMRKTSVSLVHFVFVKRKHSGFASLRLKIPLGNLIPPKILHQFSIDTPSFLHRSDGPSMEYRWSIDGVSYMEKGRMCGFPQTLRKRNISFPKKTSLNWFIPALVNSRVGSLFGTSELDDTIWCPFDLKNSRKAVLISVVVITIYNVNAP